MTSWSFRQLAVHPPQPTASYLTEVPARPLDTLEDATLLGRRIILCVELQDGTFKEYRPIVTSIKQLSDSSIAGPKVRQFITSDGCLFFDSGTGGWAADFLKSTNPKPGCKYFATNSDAEPIFAQTWCVYEPKKKDLQKNSKKSTSPISGEATPKKHEMVNNGSARKSFVDHAFYDVITKVNCIPVYKLLQPEPVEELFWTTLKKGNEQITGNFDIGLHMLILNAQSKKISLPQQIENTAEYQGIGTDSSIQLLSTRIHQYIDSCADVPVDKNTSIFEKLELTIARLTTPTFLVALNECNKRRMVVDVKKVFERFLNALETYRKTAERKALQDIDALSRILKGNDILKRRDQVNHFVRRLKSIDHSIFDIRVFENLYHRLSDIVSEGIPSRLERKVFEDLHKTLHDLIKNQSDSQNTRRLSKGAEVLDRFNTIAWLDDRSIRDLSPDNFTELNTFFNQLNQSLKKTEHRFLNHAFDDERDIDFEKIKNIDALADYLSITDFGIVFYQCVDLLKTSSNIDVAVRNAFIELYIRHAPRLVENFIITSREQCIEEIVDLFDRDHTKQIDNFKFTFNLLLTKTNDNNGLQLFILFIRYKNWLRNTGDLNIVQFIVDKMIVHCVSNTEMFEENGDTLNGCIAALGRLLKEIGEFLFENPALLVSHGEGIHQENRNPNSYQSIFKMLKQALGYEEKETDPVTPILNPVRRFLLGVDPENKPADMVSDASILSTNASNDQGHPGRLDWFRVFQSAIILIISESDIYSNVDRTRDLLLYFLSQSESTKARFDLAKNPRHLEVLDRMYESYTRGRDGTHRVSQMLINALEWEYPILKKLGQTQYNQPDHYEVLRHYFNPIMTREIDKIARLYRQPHDDDFLGTVVHMLDLRSNIEKDSTVFYRDYKKYFLLQPTNTTSYKDGLSEKLSEFSVQFNTFQRVYKDDGYDNELGRYRLTLIPIPLKILKNRTYQSIDNKIELMTRSYRFFSSEMRGFLNTQSGEIPVMVKTDFELISEDSFWMALTSFLNYCDCQEKWNQNVKEEFDTHLAEIKGLITTTQKEVQPLDRISAFKAFLNASEFLHNPPAKFDDTVYVKLEKTLDQTSIAAIPNNGEPKEFNTHIFNAYIMNAIKRRIHATKTVKLNQGDRAAIQRVKEFFYTLNDTIERTLAYHAFDPENIINGFYKLNTGNDDLQQLTRPLPENLDTVEIVKKYQRIFDEKLIDFLQYNQTLGLYLIQSLQNQDFIGQFGSGQGKSVLIGLSAMDEIKRLTDLDGNRAGKYVIVLTSYNYLAKNDHHQMKPFYMSDNNPNGGEIPSIHLHSITQFDSGFPSWGIIHADTKLFTLIVRQLFLKLAARQATRSQINFLKTVYEPRTCSLILDECDLLMHDLQTVDLNGPIDVTPYFPKQSILNFLRDTNRKYTKLEGLLQAPFAASDETHTDHFDGRRYKVVHLCEGNPQFPTIRMYPGYFCLTEFLKDVSRVIGVSATVGDGSIIKQLRPHTNVGYFKIPLFHNPEICETHVPLLGSERILDDQSEWVEEVIQNIETVYENTPSYRRPILIFLSHDTMSDWRVLGDRINRTFETTVVEYKEETDITEDGIQKAGQAGQITLSTGVLGRGADIRPPKDVDLHVIIGHKPKKEIEIQMRGRTCRMGRGGSYAHITYQAHHHLSTGQSTYNNRQAEVAHQQTKDVLIRHNYNLSTHGLSQMIDWIEPHIIRDRYLICVDGTNSMGTVFTQLKTKVKDFLSKHLNSLATDQSRVEFQIMIYRSTKDYQNGESIECSAWSSSIETLYQDFFNYKDPASGYPNQEALPLALYHIKVQAMRGGLRKAIIIGDDYDKNWNDDVNGQLRRINVRDEDINPEDRLLESQNKIKTGSYKTLLDDIKRLTVVVDCINTGNRSEAAEIFKRIATETNGKYMDYSPDKELSDLIQRSVGTPVRAGDM